MTARVIGCITTVLATSLLAQQPVPTIRSRTTLVPVDVRVVDLSGNPVTDLKQGDFVLEENGARQEIRLFQTHSLTPEPSAAVAVSGGGSLPLRQDLTPGASPVSANQRVFLLALGRGRLQYPTRGVDAVVRFVKERLLPQDRVAVMAWNRSTDFTTDRAVTLATLERFNKDHQQIEADLNQYFSSLRAQYSDGRIPPDIQAEIDAVFATRSGAAHAVAGGAITDDKRLRDDRRRAADAAQRAEINAQRIPGSGVDTTFETAAADLVGMSFDEYAETSLTTGQQLSSLYSAIMYLRHFDGEKHLIFVNEAGLFLPRLEDDKSLAAMASDARVAIDTIRTGGVITMNPLTRACPTCPTAVDPNRLARVSPNQMAMDQTMKTIAELSGGVSTSFGSPDDLLARIDRSSRFQYLLGYIPANAAWDGKYRRINVKVNRKNVRVLYRHGYYAQESLTPANRQGFLTYARIAAAGDSLSAIADLKVTATAVYSAKTREAVISVTIRLDGVKFRDEDGRHKASLQTAIFCGDDGQAIVGQDWGTVDLNLSEETYRRLLAGGVTYTKPLAVKAEPKFVKVIVYDYASDLTGSALITLTSK